jgi:plastocyanin
MHSRMRIRTWALLACLALGACGGGGSETRTARPVTPIDPATTGTVQVDVRFDGTPPAMQELRMSGFPECATQHQGPVLAGDALVKDGQVQNAFVYIKEGLGDRGFAVPTQPVVIDQKGCLYEPHVAGAQVGQGIEFRNSDAVLHNVHGSPKDSSAFNVALPRQGAERTITVDHPEVMISVRCDLHPWMQGWLGVLDHPYFGVSGADGRVTLKDVPAGDYVIGVWHERFGTREAKVSVTPKASASASVTFTPSA